VIRSKDPKKRAKKFKCKNKDLGNKSLDIMMQSFCNQINRDGSGPASMFNLSVNEFKPEFKPETQAPAEKPKEKTVNQMP